jgi:hypothetical protein
MCFSAGASFVAGTVLAGVGAVAVKKAKGTKLCLLSLIPVLFSIQQFVEGFVWLSLTKSEFSSWQNIAVYVFLTFALIIWPVFLPLAVLVSEKNKIRKRILLVTLGCGILTSLFMLYCLIFQEVTASVSYLHIHYAVNYPLATLNWGNLFYLIPTVLPAFISGDKLMKIFGVAILTSYFISFFYFKEDLVSVWCFFAAIISAVILIIVFNKKSKS